MTAVFASIARLHIVAIGAMGTFTFAWALTGVYAWPLALLAACDWFVVNIVNRVVDLVEDERNAVTGADVVARHRQKAVAIGVSVLLASLLVSAVWMPATLPARLAFHALGFAYNYKLVPWPGGRRRIKEMMLWKNVASACGFLLTCFAMPLLMYPLLPDVDVLTVAFAVGFFFFFELSYEVLYDLRDVDGDRLIGAQTWPVLFGPRGGSAVAIGQMFAAFVAVVVGYASGHLPWRIAVMGAAPLMQLAVIVPRLPHGVTSSVCIGLTWLGTALLATYHVWQYLGLPGSAP